MPRLCLSLAAITLLAVPAVAAAKEKVDPRMSAMLACGSVTTDAERLRCYDAAAAPLRQALSQGELAVNEKTRPPALEGVVKTSGSMGDNRHWVELDNGDRWEIASPSPFDEAPAAGTKVTLRKGALGNYWFSAPNANDRRASVIRRR